MCQGDNNEDKERSCNSREIDRKLQDERRENEKSDRDTIKLLLLGAGECGKSTIRKQMKLLYGVGFTEEEIGLFKTALHRNVISSAKSLVAAMDLLKIPYGFDPGKPLEDVNLGGDQDQNPNGSLRNLINRASMSESQNSNRSSRISISQFSKASLPELRVGGSVKISNSVEGVLHIATDPTSTRAKMEFEEGKKKNVKKPQLSEMIARCPENDNLSSEIIGDIKLLWRDSGIQYCYTRSSEYQLLDCCKYVMTELDRIAQPNFVPTETDIIYARIMTTKVIETRIKVDTSTTFRIFDVGGQRTERKKWAPYFQDVNSIIFVLAISDYCTVCAEDSKMNRMVESLNLFSSICNHPLFKSTAMIVFLNKIDLFREKLPLIPISATFPSYKGDNSYDDGCRYFLSRVKDINRYPSRTIYTHLTWATDRQQIQNILGAVRKILVESLLENGGIL